MTLLLLLILLHLVSDFVLQSEQLVMKKQTYYSKHSKYTKHSKLFTKRNPLWKHGLLLFIPMQGLHLFYSPMLLIVLLSALISVAHVVLDHYKFVYDKSANNKITLYLLDQGIHVLIIYGISSFFMLKATEKYIPILGRYSNDINKGQWSIPTISEDIILILIIVIVFSYMAGYLISYILENLKVAKALDKMTDKATNNVTDKTIDKTTDNLIVKTNDKTVDKKALRSLSDSEKKIGLKIGLIERFLVIVFVAVGQYGALGLILAGKSLARYEDLKDKAFAEYYLLGTLLSFLFGVIGGLLVTWVLI